MLLLAHSSRYAIEAGPETSRARLTMAPRSWFGRTAGRVRIIATPRPDQRASTCDPFANRVDTLSWGRGRELTAVRIEVQLEIAGAGLTRWAAPPPPADEAPHPLARPSPEIAHYARVHAHSHAHSQVAAGPEPLAAAASLCAAIHRDIAYDRHATDESTDAATVLSLRRGICQDMAHLLVASLRSLGHTARYVGGYRLAHLPDPAAPIAPAELHAWVAVNDGAGTWHALDATDPGGVGPLHVPVAWGRAFEDIAPIRFAGPVRFRGAEIYGSPSEDANEDERAH